MSQFNSISTQGMRPPEKMAIWRNSAVPEMGHPQGASIQAHAFDGFLEFGALDDLKFYRLNATPHQLVSSPGIGRQAPRGYVKAVFQMRGTTHYEQMGRDITLEPGSWLMYDMDLPYLIDVRKSSEVIALMVPRHAVATGRFEFRDLCLNVFSGTTGLGKILYNMVSNTYQEFDKIDPATAPDLSLAITQLMRSHLLRVCKEQSPQTLSDVLHQRVRRYILMHLRTPDLSLDQIARAMHCTKRYLHKAFEKQDLSISEFILNQRLERCREALQTEAQKNESITSIALSWGFTDGAHFSRTFRRRFNMSPSQYRVSIFGIDMMR